MRKYIALALALVASSANAQTRPLGNWTILNGVVPVTYDAQGLPGFTFPTGRPYRTGVNYFTTSISGISTAAKGLGITWRIDVTGAPWFDFRTNSNNTCNLPPAGSPPVSTARLFIQRRGDDMSGVGVYQQYRYWSQVGFAQLVNGTVTVKADFNPAQWTDVYGKPGSQYPDRFAAAIRNAQKVGVTLGGGCFYGHGVFVDTGTGTAKFTVTSFGAY